MASDTIYHPGADAYRPFRVQQQRLEEQRRILTDHPAESLRIDHLAVRPQMQLSGKCPLYLSNTRAKSTRPRW